MDRVDRRRFLKTAGAVGGAAAVLGAPGLALAEEEREAPVVKRPSAIAGQPVVVFVRDAARGEVTVLHGTRETTLRDRRLVRRLLRAARATGSRG